MSSLSIQFTQIHSFYFLAYVVFFVTSQGFEFGGKIPVRTNNTQGVSLNKIWYDIEINENFSMYIMENYNKLYAYETSGNTNPYALIVLSLVRSLLPAVESIRAFTLAAIDSN